MKNLYTSKTNTYKQLMHFALVAFMACFVSFNSYSQVRVDFEERSSVYTPAKTIYNVKGDFTMIGNTNLTLENYSNTRANGGNDMIYVDVDNDPYTLNSSSATLTLSEENDANPECSNIIYAGLYWSGRSGSANTFNVTKDVLTGNTTSQQVTETDIIYPTENIPNTNYTITKTVSNGTYTFKFTSSGAGDTYNFIYRTSGNNKTLHVKVNGGSETAVSTFIINNNNAYLSTPYSIYSGTDYSFELTRFRLQGTDRAFINITYTEEIPETVQVTKNYDKHQISIKGPGASTYTQLTASNNEIYYPTNTDQYIFSAYTEVTDYVKTNGLGDYVVADMALKEGDPDGTGYFGGWGMVVVYENTLMKWRDITIFDGHAFVKSGDSGYQIDVDGFNAVQSGDVNFKLGVMAGEGDVAYSGDSFQIENKNTATYTSLSHSGNSTSNFFNSSIATGGNTRNPNLVNNSGMDISMFDVNNTNNAIIDNNQTSTSFKYFTNGDTYSIYNVTFSIEAYIPVSEGLLSASSINGNPPTYPLEVVPGDIVEYNVEIRNKGTEPIVDGKLVIPIPFTSNYVYSSLSYNEFHSLFQGNPPYFDPNEGATGAIVWDFSYLPLNSTDIEMILADITFELEATTDCSILINDNCEPKIVILGGYIEGTGEISKVDYQLPLIQGYQEDGNCQGEPNTDPIAVSIDSEQYILDNCTGISVERDFYYCSITGNSIPVSEVEANFPPGSLFYDSYPITSSTIQYTDTTPLPATIGLNTYYAIPPGNSTCNYIFTIEINEIETTPEVANISYCFEETASPLTATVTNSDYSVFFFADNNPSTTGQATLIPNTDTSGVFTYYAAEGPSNTCSGTRTPFTVTVHPEITITLEDITNESCAESNDGTIDISVSGGSGTYTYDWDNNGAENPDTDAQDLSGADNGTHTVIVTDTTTDCTATASYTISASLAVAPTITAPSTIAVEGCSVTNATNNNETTLSYSETLTTITEAQFTTEGGTYTGSDILSITYQDATTTSTDCEITVTRTFTLTNTCNLTASGTQKISIKDTTAPQLIGTVPSGSTNLNTCASEMPEGPSIADITALFTDNCGTVNVTKATENTGNNCAWSVDYTYKITDACGNAASDIVITYSGEDKTNPTFVQTLPETSITVECNNIPDAATLTATDNCGDAAVTYEETKTDGSCDSTYTLTRVWTATDTCDNTTEFTQTVNVQDNTAPVIATLPATSTIECSQTISFTQATVTDACSSDVSLTFEDVTVNGTCDKNYTVTRTWTATDNCGNFSTATQIIQVEDTIAPVIDTTNKENLQIQCGVTPEGSLENWLTNNAGATATDACGTVTWTNDYGQNTDLDCERGAITVTFTATDSCTNTATTTATYSIMDTVDPILTLPANVTIECSDDATPTNTGTATATDDCATPAVTFTDATAAGDCPNSSVITRTWSVTDACDNTTTLTQTINVLDTTAPTFTVPADVTIECSDDATDLTVTGNVADIADNCATDLEATFTDATAAGDCPNSSVITRTWSVTDACDNTTTLTQTINVLDTTAPTFTVPADVTIECSDDATDLTVTGNVADITDNCATDLEATFTDATAAGDCPNSSVITRTWSVTDACDNTTTLTQTINVLDTTAPTFTVPADVTIECSDDATDLTVTGNVADITDNCATDLEATFTDATAAGDCPNSSVITRTWSVTDACDNTTTLTQTINVLDTTAPTFTVPADVTIECSDDATDLTVTGNVADITDNCATDLEATFTDATAAGDCPNSSVITRTWSVTDACDNTTTLTQTINVLDTTAPTFTVPADVTIECSDDATDLTVTGNVADIADNCATDLEATFTDATATGDCPNSSVITRTWSVTDACDNTTTLTQTINVLDTTAPTFTVPADVTIECSDDATDLTVTGNVADITDNCATDLEATFTDATATGDCPNSSVITRTWSVTDACDNTTTLTQTINVLDTTAPTFTVPADVTIECSDDATDLTVTGNVADITDNCATDLEATFTDATAAGDCPNSSVITRTWSVTDACDNTTTLTQTINVLDTTAPTFTVPADVTIECSDDATDLTVTGNVADITDNCATDLEATFTDATAAGDCPNSSVITRTWSVTDACDNTTTLTQTINVLDTTAPTFTVPADVTIECSDDATDLTVTGNVADITDNCATDLEATFTDATAAGDCPNSSVITRTWSVTDACDNTTTLTQTINVLDTTAPTFTVPADVTIECSDDATDLTVTGNVADIADNCATDLEATFTDATAAGDCPNSSVITRTWSVTDACDNTTTLTQTINVLDTTAPTFTVPADVTIECSDDATDLTVTGNVADITDNCATDLEATFTDATAAGDCPNSSVITRTWSVTDACDNTTTLTQTINVLDTTAPTFTVPADVTIECSDDATDLTVTGNVADITDNCATDLEATFTDATATGDCPNSSVITRTWSVTDACDNTTTLTQTINVLDTTAPTLVGTYQNVVESVCSNIPEIPELSFTDTCSSEVTVDFEEAYTDSANGESYIITRTWTASDDCNNQSIFTQTVNVIVENNILSNNTSFCITEDFDFDLFDTLSGDVDPNGEWTVTVGDAQIDGNYFNPSTLLYGDGSYDTSALTDYVFTYTTNGNCPTVTELTVNINDECVVLACGDEESVIISKSITPNGDQWNEYFTVTGIELCGFTVELQIFNRWGAKIYENSNYNNDWNGFSHNSSVGASDQVPTGTYYYIINLKDSGLKPFSGPIYVGTK